MIQEYCKWEMRMEMRMEMWMEMRMEMRNENWEMRNVNVQFRLKLDI